ncbi:MAG: type II toxin-antitoxin system HicA family toxin [Bacteroidales bacterium]|nr:type II toxin-antitoxin system HicA family toxin [Bacteroidales bacterium]MBR4487008.1 type II toxin-antitoxin system HicA family toxin [Bacteroidales bacterium]
MGKKEKLIQRLLTQPKDFTYSELSSLLFQLGFAEDNKGETSGSRVRFFHVERKLQYLAHKPHPANIIKQKALKDIIVFLKVNNLI